MSSGKQTQCHRCVMDGSAQEIVFTETGCNFCDQALLSLESIKPLKEQLPDLTKEIKNSGGQYDCLIGLSGGVDSSMVLVNAVKLGLRPLTFSVDNGWNDPKADANVMKLVEGLKVPFYRYVIDKKEFVKLQGAFLKAGVPNVEIPTDHVLMAATYEMADKYGIKWILSGGNVATESIMPPSWGYNARDLTHIKAIYRWATGEEIPSSLPLCSLWKWNWYKWVKGIKTAYLLDYIGYNRAESIKYLEEHFGWEDYYEKHCESVFTAWFQNYFLFEKFGFDKRKAHLSSLIVSGQMTRDQAMYELSKNPVYPKIGLEKQIFAYPKRTHDDFPKDRWYERVAYLVKLCT